MDTERNNSGLRAKSRCMNFRSLSLVKERMAAKMAALVKHLKHPYPYLVIDSSRPAAWAQQSTLQVFPIFKTAYLLFIELCLDSS